MLDDEAISLFRAEIKGVKPLKQDRFVPPCATKKNQMAVKEIREQQDTLFYFSDEYEPLLNDESAVKYLRENEDSHLLKQLRRGDFSPEIFLDLHGLTREQAKLELAALIQDCEKEHIYCASIMTGYGTYTLKRQIPRWLVQHPKVRALHQAPKEWGGDAAILILIDV
ncbi:endonuclease SmrB [Aggregatibacter actinomycetemcomitans]|uniref:endonuclease SmrB n=1 Tax=Aggregatibacter actinomycetemcomitans TaxID=714 RepID=UPI0011D97B31|nr:endonuclease SmrB [Aggregatibacter actinomycetemcomitans]QEH48024.1 endonuclease SmrB [Aggregatibacter actinomycetemcomitans]QEH50019.1 endonuclease SmrB [Aggregatibacter actinomycetemcomitans]TYA49122.1 endonuclease SmrB [Aggregatibacter actinomycetemcomitans]TYA51177.1 endonuclease SmrB [Aggregatibacter actinomycetemcomitans]TYB29310.1 endonuclease SmrB [Aggregatibacter actinomycetemcomitans]